MRRVAVTQQDNGIQSGFTIIELLLAIVVFTIGLLALAGSSAVIIMRIGDAHSRITGARVASARLETLASLKCGSQTSGSASGRGILESWNVSASGAGWSRVQLTVTFENRGRVESFSVVMPCS